MRLEAPVCDRGHEASDVAVRSAFTWTVNDRIIVFHMLFSGRADVPPFYLVGAPRMRAWRHASWLREASCRGLTTLTGLPFGVQTLVLQRTKAMLGLLRRRLMFLQPSRWRFRTIKNGGDPDVVEAAIRGSAVLVKPGASPKSCGPGQLDALCLIDYVASARPASRPAAVSDSPPEAKPLSEVIVDR